jgi:catechol 2,3-dioxygenase-like lactoylglutathione lyase family enzyme
VARFNNSGLDHVAIAVADVERSCEFYARVLGFERMCPEWDVPVVMGTNGTGLAIFDQKVHARETPEDAGPPSVRILHVAFRLDGDGFAAARRDLAAEGIEMKFYDHGITHSIYFLDPDDHVVELTTYDV